MKKILFLFSAILLGISTAYAVPAKPVKKTMKTVDGKTIEVVLRGDEHFSFYADNDGTPFLKRKDGRLERISKDEVTDRWTSMKQRNMEIKSSAIPVNSRRTQASRRIGTPATTTGNHRGLVILVEFSDQEFLTPNPKETYMRFFNEVGYKDNGNAGSVKDYFLAQSYNQLILDFDVAGPYKLGHTMKFYGAPDGSRHDVAPQEMAADAVELAAADVDYSNYDWDNDGWVDQVFIIFAGYNEAQGADENTIWPHESSIYQKSKRNYDNGERYNGKIVSTYGCSSELRGDGKTWGIGQMDGIGTACHEFSHCLGLPDMYDTSGDSFGMSCWDVMDQGSYNDNSCTPAGYSSYERWFSGWMEPVEVNTMTRIKDMKPLATNAEAYILYNDANKNEYYLLENRQPVGFDKGLYGHGLLILHVDYDKEVWASNKVNAVSNHQRMTVIPADNVLSYKTLSGDTWPGKSGNTSLTNFTTPAATLFNNNSDGTNLMNKAIDNITEDETAMTVSFVACRPDLAVPSTDDGTEVQGKNAFTVTWPAVSGAVGYQLELTEIGAVAKDPKDALLREIDFSGCVSKSVGFSDISSKLGDYGLASWSGSKLYTTPSKLRIGTSSSTGYLRTPSWWKVPDSQEITFVIGADVAKAGDEVQVALTIESVFTGGYNSDIVAEKASFSVTGNGLYVVSFSVPKENDLFRLTITPNKQMYINYLSVYDGTWTAEQLGLETVAAPRRASEPQYFESATNSYTFTNLNTSNRYIFRVRAMGEENTYSQWSAEKTFQFSSSAPDYTVGDANGDGVVDVADVVAIVNKILEKPAENFNEKAADVNGDGVIDVSDVVGVVNIILSKE